jgi:uncharacterized protein with PQ loop repeat
MISTERVVSGMGLENLYQAICAMDGVPTQSLSPDKITAGALSATDAQCVAAVEMFCAILGTAAANLVVTLGARAGCYIGGASFPALEPTSRARRFAHASKPKGRFSSYVSAVPDLRDLGPDACIAGLATLFPDSHETMNAIIDSIGLVAGVLTTVHFVPQVWKIYRSKSGKDVSARMFWMLSAGVVLWLFYGIQLQSLPLILTNGVTLVLSLAIIALRSATAGRGLVANETAGAKSRDGTMCFPVCRRNPNAVLRSHAGGVQNEITPNRWRGRACGRHPSAVKSAFEPEICQ